MIRANKLTQLEGPRNVGRIWRKRRFWRNLVDENKANKLTQLEGPRNVGENGKFGENGDFGEILPRLLTK